MIPHGGQGAGSDIEDADGAALGGLEEVFDVFGELAFGVEAEDPVVHGAGLGSGEPNPPEPRLVSDVLVPDGAGFFEEVWFGVA